MKKISFKIAILLGILCMGMLFYSSDTSAGIRGVPGTGSYMPDVGGIGSGPEFLNNMNMMQTYMAKEMARNNPDEEKGPQHWLNILMNPNEYTPEEVAQAMAKLFEWMQNATQQEIEALFDVLGITYTFNFENQTISISNMKGNITIDLKNNSITVQAGDKTYSFTKLPDGNYAFTKTDAEGNPEYLALMNQQGEIIYSLKVDENTITINIAGKEIKINLPEGVNFNATIDADGNLVLTLGNNPIPIVVSPDGTITVTSADGRTTVTIDRDNVSITYNKETGEIKITSGKDSVVITPEGEIKVIKGTNPGEKPNNPGEKPWLNEDGSINWDWLANNPDAFNDFMEWFLNNLTNENILGLMDFLSDNPEFAEMFADYVRTHQSLFESALYNLALQAINTHDAELKLNNLLDLLVTHAGEDLTRGIVNDAADQLLESGTALGSKAAEILIVSFNKSIRGQSGPPEDNYPDTWQEWKEYFKEHGFSQEAAQAFAEWLIEQAKAGKLDMDLLKEILGTELGERYLQAAISELANMLGGENAADALKALKAIANALIEIIAEGFFDKDPIALAAAWTMHHLIDKTWTNADMREFLIQLKEENPIPDGHSWYVERLTWQYHIEYNAGNYPLSYKEMLQHYVNMWERNESIILPYFLSYFTNNARSNWLNDSGNSGNSGDTPSMSTQSGENPGFDPEAADEEKVDELETALNSGSESAADQLRQIAEQNNDPAVRQAALAALRNAAKNNNNPDVKKAAIKALGKAIGNILKDGNAPEILDELKEIVGKLSELLNSSEFQTVAANALSQIFANITKEQLETAGIEKETLQDVMKQLKESILESTDKEFIKAAIDVITKLAKAGDIDAIGLLEEIYNAFKEKQGELRNETITAIIKALAEIGTKQAIEQIKTWLENDTELFEAIFASQGGSDIWKEILKTLYDLAVNNQDLLETIMSIMKNIWMNSPVGSEIDRSASEYYVKLSNL